MIEKQEPPKGAGKKLVFIFMIILLSFQLIQVNHINPEYNQSDEIKVSKELISIFKRACYDCHSNETIWPWYSYIAPFSWEVVRHVDTGRAYLNFSIWKTYNKVQKDKILNGIYRTIYAAMPPQNYISIHQNAKISNEDKKLIRNWTGKSPF